MKNLPKLRRTACLTQHALGEIAKVSRAKIANVETGRAEFTAAEAQRILAVLGKAISENAKLVNQSLGSAGS